MIQVAHPGELMQTSRGQVWEQNDHTRVQVPKLDQGFPRGRCELCLARGGSSPHLPVVSLDTEIMGDIFKTFFLLFWMTLVAF